MPDARKKDKPTTRAEPWMTVGAAARAIGESRLATLTRIVKGELVGQHLAGQTFVRRDSLETFLAGRKK
jgi:hypothetical protein